MEQSGDDKKRYLQILVAAILLVGTTTLFVLIGTIGKICFNSYYLKSTNKNLITNINITSWWTTGPKSSQGTFHGMHMCIVPSASDHVWKPGISLIDEKSCREVGREFVRESEDPKKLKHYPLKNVIFYVQIPYMKKQVMSRDFEFLIADLGIHFTFSSYLMESISKCLLLVRACTV